MFEDVERFVVKTGTGRSEISPLNAVDNAMVNASIGDLNLIKVTSILPKNIEKTDRIDQKRGAFRPAVLSTVTGSGKELIAGLAWGTREDEKGGYVIEHSSRSNDLDMDRYKEELEEKLDEMAEIRDIMFKKKEFAFDRMKVDEDVFGCVIAALVYLP